MSKPTVEEHAQLVGDLFNHATITAPDVLRLFSQHEFTNLTIDHNKNRGTSIDRLSQFYEPLTAWNADPKNNKIEISVELMPTFNPNKPFYNVHIQLGADDDHPLDSDEFCRLLWLLRRFNSGGACNLTRDLVAKLKTVRGRGSPKDADE